MAARHRGYVVTQGVRLSDLFRRAGYPTRAVSSSRNRYYRLFDIVARLVVWGTRIDVLIVHVYSGPSFVVADAASRLGRLFGHRIVMLLHGGGIPEFIKTHPSWSAKVLGRADAIVSPSPFLQRAVQAAGFECRIIPNVIEIDAYPFRLRRVVRPRLFWMRSFHPIYNPTMAVRVLARLCVHYPEATLVMGGQDKGMQSEVEALARALNVGDRVSFPGFLDMPGKIREGALADICINTSHVDNMPVALVEAGAFGMPNVTTRVGGIPDLLQDGETCLFVPDGDVVGMTSAIERLLKEPNLAEHLSRGGRRVAELSSWDHVRPLWEDLLGELLRRRPAAS
jgi:glycosyltransferase involved in cell wall biosynthesis